MLGDASNSNRINRLPNSAYHAGVMRSVVTIKTFITSATLKITSVTIE